jgi:hypothetical protein
MDFRSIINLVETTASLEIDEDVKFPLRKGVLGSARGNYAAMIAVMDPRDFIRLTTPNKEIDQIYKGKFASSVADYKSGVHPEFNKDQYNMPFLYVEHATGKVKGHEGRHRAAMVAKEGGKKFPCVLIFKELREWAVTYTEAPFTEDGEFGEGVDKEQTFSSQDEANAFQAKLKQLNNDVHHGSYYSRIEIETLGGGTMKGSPRSDPSNWEFKAWEHRDMPPQLVGQFDQSVIIPTDRMQHGVVKGYRHFK